MKTLNAGNVLFGLSRETPIKVFTIEYTDDKYAYSGDTTFFRQYDDFVSYRKETKRLIGVTKLVSFNDEKSAKESPLYKTYIARNARSFCTLFDYSELSEDDIVLVRDFLLKLREKPKYDQNKMIGV